MKAIKNVITAMICIMLLMSSYSKSQAFEVPDPRGFQPSYMDGTELRMMQLGNGNFTYYSVVCEVYDGEEIDLSNIVRYGDHADETGYIVDYKFWLPSDSWYRQMTEEDKIDIVGYFEPPVASETPLDWESVTTKPIKRCPICHHKKKGTKRKSHYKWCKRYPEKPKCHNLNITI